MNYGSRKSLSVPTRRLLPAFVAVALLIGGCSASVPATGPLAVWSSCGKPALRLAVAEDAELPAAFVRLVETETGIRIVQIPVSQEAAQELVSGAEDIELPEQAEGLITVGPDATDVGSEGTRFGEDDICTLVDSAWYSANNLEIPKTLDGESPGIREGSAFLTVRPAGVAGTDSRFEILSGSCRAVGVYLLLLDGEGAGSKTRERFEDLEQYLLSPEGQEAVGAYGLAFPLGTRTGQNILVSSTTGREITITRPVSG